MVAERGCAQLSLGDSNRSEEATDRAMAAAATGTDNANILEEYKQSLDALAERLKVMEDGTAGQRQRNANVEKELQRLGGKGESADQARTVHASRIQSCEQTVQARLRWMQSGRRPHCGKKNSISASRK